jgi:GT2 family glycosyltransferase
MIAVCIPYRENGDHRQRAYRYVEAWWQRLGYPVFTAAGPDGPFNRSAARNQAARQAGKWKVAVFADADTIGDPALIDISIQHAANGHLSYPFTEYAGLSATGTRRLIEGGGLSGPYKRKRLSPGGILAVSRQLFEQVGGWDEAFQGWGYEDLAFSYAAGTLGGIRREPGRIHHLWHPIVPEKRDAIAGRTINRTRMMRYRVANGDQEAMRRLLGNLRG